MGGCAGKQKNVMSKAVVKIRQPDTKPVSSIPNADGQKPDNKKKKVVITNMLRFQIQQMQVLYKGGLSKSGMMEM